MAGFGIELSESLASLVESVGKSVVRVTGRHRAASSGVVWEPGLVVTTHHGLEADVALSVDLGDGLERPATHLGSDPGTDLALLRIDPGQGSPARFDEGAGLKVGYLVLKLGRPGKTVRATAGIVSALGRNSWRTRSGSEISSYLETDAAPSPGFSGGPLLGLEGGVLGINTSGLLRGVSLTVPTATVRQVVASLLAHGRIRRGYLGVSSQPVHLPGDVQQATGEEVGLLILAVEPGGPADKAGLVFGDTVLRLGGDEVKDFGDLQAFLREDHVGQTVPLKILRSAVVKDLSITIGQRP